MKKIIITLSIIAAGLAALLATPVEVYESGRLRMLSLKRLKKSINGKNELEADGDRLLRVDRFGTLLFFGVDR